MQMLRHVAKNLLKLRIGCCGLAVALVTCLVMPGCAHMDVREEESRQDELSSMARRCRGSDAEVETFSFSNKGRQIEKDLGVR